MAPLPLGARRLLIESLRPGVFVAFLIAEPATLLTRQLKLLLKIGAGMGPALKQFKTFTEACCGLTEQATPKQHNLANLASQR